LLTVLIGCLAFPAARAQQLTGYVDPLIGTAASSLQGYRGQLGNTIPAVAVPFAMTQWTAETRQGETKCQAPYYHSDPSFTGIRATHWLSGSCTQDYGSFTLMPETGALRTEPQAYACPLNHALEKATPYDYSIRLPRYHLTASFTATARCGIIRFTCQREDTLYVVVRPNSDKNKTFIRIDHRRGEVSGSNAAFRIYQGSGQPAGFAGYFVLRFSRPFFTAGTFSKEGVTADDSVRNGENEGAYVGFLMKKGESLLVKAGTSFTGIAAAADNLDAEIPGWDFGSVRDSCRATWENALEKIQVSGGTASQKKIFYTSLYHTMQQPRLYNDVNGTYPRFSASYVTETLQKGNYYGDFSMWDIYRSDIPLYEILSPALVNDWVRSMILKGQQGGWLPIFPCWNNYTSEMIGDHVLEFIASAWCRGIRDYDVREAYRLMRHNSFDTPPREDYVDGKGRRALSSYLRYGYIPLNDSVADAFHKNEQVSRTLEYAYDDYSTALMAKGSGNKKDYRMLMKRAGNYRNVFDRRVGLMNGRFADGSWAHPFYPDKRMSYITEGTPRQYSFYVPQDIPGLAKLMGGRRQLESQLDSLFTGDRYNHGNEPDQQAPFLYDYTPHPWKTQLQVRNILERAYGTGPGGISGNDDAGAISAWYIFAAMGFYPANPVSGDYLISSPLFDTLAIRTGAGKVFKVVTHRHSRASVYISRVTWNRKPYLKDYLRHSMFTEGGRLDIFLEDQPTGWASNPRRQPRGL
jgi:predicted alpha-1,2-mannosidase